MRKNIFDIFKLIALYKEVKNIKPDTVHTWMYQSNLIGGFISKLVGVKNIIWSIHHNKLGKNRSKATRLFNYLGAKCSGLIPNKIVTVSNISNNNHINIGYLEDKMLVIPNGVNIEKYNVKNIQNFPKDKELGTNNKRTVLAMIARYDTSKDFNNLIESIKIIKSKKIKLECLLIGPGLDSENKELVDKIDYNKVDNYFILLGPRDDIPDILNSVDINILSSRNESFGLVLAEAMACGVPCISTDVGDARSIIGSNGWVIEPSNPNKLAESILEGIRMLEKSPAKWRTLKRNCRTHIKKKFSLGYTLDLYKNVWSLEKR